ncbi:thioredoxin domain-containing protein 5 homolog [Hydractinia symbiolongicarpus]|uniref:thioredoxin domain-containing protein 5 homolog n=1 Tax=Hydractinia symbiolongicarpus TaxID=13093 RepID=UPI0025519110|nr:thioredoxin domain-containing protein 5 homolog [Hydractinia symbiolongicarpus]
MATILSMLRRSSPSKIAFLTLINIVVVSSNKAELYTMQNFDSVRSSSYPHFVMFYAPWCGHCKRIQTLWDKFAEENHSRRRFKVAKVDCTQTTPLCASESIKAYPTLRLFNDHKKYTYKGNRNIAGLNEFVNMNIKSIKDWQVPINSERADHEIKAEVNRPVKAKVLSSDTFQKEIEEKLAFVDFYAPWCPHCVQLEPVWNELATHFKHESAITIAKVDCTAEPDLCQREDITAYPSLNLYKNGQKISSYQHSRDLANLIQFVESASVGEDVVTVPMEEFLLIEPEDVEGEDSNHIVQYIDGHIFSNKIQLNPHLVYFHNEWFQTSNDHLETFSKVSKSLKQWDSNVNTAVVDCVLDSEFCSKYKITSFPSIMYIMQDEKDFLLYEGDLAVTPLVKFAIDPYDISNEKKKDGKVEL